MLGVEKGEEVERSLSFQVHLCTGQFCNKITLKERAGLSELVEKK